MRDEFLTRDLSHIHTLRDLNAAFIEWLETTYHNRIHTTLGMKPIDRFGLDLDRIRYLASSDNQNLTCGLSFKLPRPSHPVCCG